MNRKKLCPLARAPTVICFIVHNSVAPRSMPYQGQHFYKDVEDADSSYCYKCQEVHSVDIDSCLFAEKPPAQVISFVTRATPVFL